LSSEQSQALVPNFCHPVRKNPDGSTFGSGGLGPKKPKVRKKIPAMVNQMRNLARTFVLDSCGESESRSLLIQRLVMRFTPTCAALTQDGWRFAIEVIPIPRPEEG